MHNIKLISPNKRTRTSQDSLLVKVELCNGSRIPWSLQVPTTTWQVYTGFQRLYKNVFHTILRCIVGFPSTSVEAFVHRNPIFPPGKELTVTTHKHGLLNLSRFFPCGQSDLVCKCLYGLVSVQITITIIRLLLPFLWHNSSMFLILKIIKQAQSM